ncbi:Adenine DNA glycosylase [bioreactor metagenome]|uniref:Adenine DNA glycosylase n=1 Tax=bioreactor metagenome TaxID=1076179 RepID=A0A644TRS5_9ZZZZ|nr:A/G-specific adenine glycosylase [Negativicutes bacterium]
MVLATQLLDWYDKNSRDLPWRKDNDAYKVWVSEIMLQQTRVEVVKDYYTRWMERFPTLEALAQTSEQEVLTYWQGLGYYNRARNLLSGVREVCAEYGGKVPDNAPAIQKLPGVGEYTAGAIASIAYNRPSPAIDGNVLRIFSRLFCLEEDITKQATKRKIDRLIRDHMSVERPGDFNQALMDLGSMVCIPQRPRCQLCPLATLCEAQARDVQDVLPVRTPKKAPLHIKLAAGIVIQSSSLLITQRPATGMLAGMWEFPTVELAEDDSTSERLKTRIKSDLQQEVCVGKRLFHYIHTFSHRKWDISFYQCQWLAGNTISFPAHWLGLSELDTVPWAGPHRKVATVLGEQFTQEL